MTAKIIDGRALATEVKADVKERVEQLKENGVIPTLAAVLVGEDPASKVYVNNKIKACKECGIKSAEFRLPAETTQEDLLELIDRLNNDDDINGILVQLPLPSHLDAHRVIESISPGKDVDGFHIENAGKLMQGLPGFRPCTPFGIIRMLESTGVDLRGKHAVVVGRSNIVGKPMATMLLEKDCTVSVAHSKTQDLGALTRQADIIIAATGRRNTVTRDMVKPGAIVIDVGINRDENNKLCGDVAKDVAEVAGWISPVPGGVGPMTIAMLLDNTVTSCEARVGKFDAI